MVKNYNFNVFYNCPFDEQYEPTFQAVLFTIYRCGFTLRCAKEFNDTGKVRIENIVKLIEESKYGIHDLCRVELDNNLKLPRFNMPLELGIFIGAIKFGTKNVQKAKEYLILDNEKFRFKSFISDLGGQDIKSYSTKETAIRVIRDWLSNKTDMVLPSSKFINDEYLAFQKDLPEICESNKWVKEELTYEELVSLTVSWIELNRA
ncbi:MAG: hypothetical protein WKG06_21725 [Segetibacter sp.]